ncbi:MAG: ThuA domain-containing protein [Candidatus Limivivens sp.]|nr:ThuA domain-containing protein [Candidatus Limivivens sp.]
MIRVTIWNEYVQEQLDKKEFAFTKAWNAPEEAKQMMAERAREIRRVHGGAIHDTLKALLEEDEELCVKHIGTLEMEECGLTEEVLSDTDVLIWWSHIAQEQVPDEVAERVRSHVQRGMGMIFLHSAHMCKPMGLLLGTSGTLRWREGDFCRVWNTCPTHPIAQGIPEYFELEEEEMYGEYFDIPKPEDQVFLSWYRGGELFRSGCTWTRGMGRIFYFQPGHETNRSYFNENVRRIIRNAVKWTAEPGIRQEKLECIHAAEPLER